MIKKILFILDKRDTRKFILILFLTLLNTFFEIIGIGLIIPILTYFINDNSQTFIDNFYIFKDISKSNLLIYVLILFNLSYLFKFFTSLLLTFIKNKFAWNLFANLSSKIFDLFINKKYLIEDEKNIAEKIQLVRGEANQFSFAVINPIIDLIIETILFLSICIFLLFYNFKISLIVILFFLILSLFWNKYYNNHLKILGDKRRIYSIGAINEIQNSFGNFKETLIYKLGPIFYGKFNFFNKNNSIVGYKRDTITQLPKLLLELLSVSTILVITIILINKNISLSDILIFIGVFVFATVRMLPSVAKIIRSIQTLKFNSVVIDKIYDEFNSKNIINNLNNSEDKINFRKLQLENLFYSYPSNSSRILKNINLEISKGQHFGFIGKTGSGKSTLINILSGFIKINEGSVILNEKPINGKLESWQKIIGYVPHDVFILNDSIEYNITFQRESEIDKDKIQDILKEVELKDFINSLDKKEKTIIGERGKDLSRGQCQRIGLARAMYKAPQVLILDEATGALDIKTEKLILERLYKNKRNLTIISISHRKNSLEFCDKIFKIDGGMLNEIKFDEI